MLNLLAVSALLCAQSSIADQYLLEGVRKDGLVIGFDTIPPTTVFTQRQRKNGSSSEYTNYRDEGCELSFIPYQMPGKAATFSCPASGMSPLAGTTYAFRKHVGKDCEKENVFDLYVCVSGCNSRKAPRILKGTSSCY
jgi:hypothetical protein